MVSYRRRRKFSAELYLAILAVHCQPAKLKAVKNFPYAHAHVCIFFSAKLSLIFQRPELGGHSPTLVVNLGLNFSLMQ